MKNNIWDRMKGFANSYSADDSQYDDMDDQMEDGFGPEQDDPDSRYAPRRSPFGSASNSFDTSDIKPEPLGDSFSAPSPSFQSDPLSSTGFRGQILGGSASDKTQTVLSQPKSFNEISRIAENLRHRRAVLLNLEGVDRSLSMRCVDFLSGCTFAVDGSVKKVAAYTYMFCPNNMEVVDDMGGLEADPESIV